MNQKPNAIMVCVDYADLLAITLPYNRHHFRDVMIVTSPSDVATQDLANRLGVGLYITDSFYAGGAVFNKWLALEYGLDFLGRDGWLCIMDADVLWPKVLPEFRLEPGKLYTPFRRMFEDVTQPIPEEADWAKYPRHRQEKEFAGYSQIFHADDPALGVSPWHETNWRHAGGADSFFQAKWAPTNKVRPPFDVLHLGPAGQNWCGRATRYADGSEPTEADEKRRQLRDFVRSRDRNAPDPYAQEKIGGTEAPPL